MAYLPDNDSWSFFRRVGGHIATGPTDTNVGDIQDVHGWCYVDPSIRLGDPSIVADCPSTEQRKIRFTGRGEAQQGATLFITCSGE